MGEFFDVELKDRIRQLRAKKGFTTKQLGHVFNVSESTISLYETGKRTPSKDMIIKMAEYFNVSTDYLLGRTDDPTPIGKPNRERSVDEVLEELIKKVKYVDHMYYQDEPIPLDKQTREILVKMLQNTKEIAETTLHYKTKREKKDTDQDNE